MVPSPNQQDLLLRPLRWFQSASPADFEVLLHSRWGRLLAQLVTLGLLLIVAWHLADLSWRLGYPSNQQPQGGLASTLESAASEGQTPDLRSVAGMHLFGRPQTTSEGLADASAVESASNFSLKGVIVGDPVHPGGAIIADADNQDRYYPHGAALPGGAQLVTVAADHVLLRQDGRVQKLGLPVALQLNQRSGPTAVATLPTVLALGQAVAPPGSMQPPAPPSSNQPASTSLDRLKQEFLAEPQKLVELIQPVTKDSQAQGYALQPKQLHHVLLFHSAGMRKGDRITAINGIPLTNPEELPNLLRGQSELNFTFERDDESANASLQPKP